MDKDPKLIIHTTDPVNAEPPLDKLMENFITPQPLYYIRNHGPIPEINVEEYRLVVNGMVDRELEFNLNAIMHDFEKHTVMATLQCAGNRRVQLIEYKEVPGEVPWQEGAIGNAVWAGARLKDILQMTGVRQEAQYVAFMGADEVIRHNENVGFGASIPVRKALTDDVILAYEMNGKPLEPTHGFPLRGLVPGYIGARSVKWLTHITLQEAPSKNYFQDHAYRLFPPEAKPETVIWETGIQLSDLAVNCVITTPRQNEIITKQDYTAEGWAMSGDGRKITRVEVSTDGGLSWHEAAISESGSKWAWVFWKVDLHLHNGITEIIARAFDDGNFSQPEDIATVWNFKGYMNNAWHKLPVSVKI